MNMQARAVYGRMVAALMMVSCFGSAYAGITVDATATFVTPVTTWTSSQTFDASSFDPSGSGKLVAVIMGRGGEFLTTPTVTFNGVTMSNVVTRPTPGVGTHRGVSSIFYLDSPPTGGNLVLTYNTQIQDLGIALFALSDTAAGFSGPTLSSNSSLSGTITTSVDGSLVIAGGWYGDGASSTLSVDSPLTSVLSAPIDAAAPFSAAAAGYYLDLGAGDVGISFTGANGTPVNNLVAAGFLPTPPPAGTLIVIK